MKLIILTIMVSACGVPEEKTDEFLMSDEAWHEATKQEEEGPTNEPNKWTLDEIDMEQFKCEDDYFDFVKNANQFCSCLVERIAVRWGYESFLRHKFSYMKRMSDNGTIRRCNDTTLQWTAEEEQSSIVEDQLYDPESDTEINDESQITQIVSESLHEDPSNDTMEVAP